MPDRTVARFWAKVDRRGPDECWPWTASLYPSGYGHFKAPPGQSGYAHRIAYESLIGPIPAGMQLDHLCHNQTVCPGGDACPHRRCVNPAHLDPVTNRENALRSHATPSARTHCKYGHEFTPENTHYPKNGRRRRFCRACMRRRKQSSKQRRRASETAPTSA